MTRKTRFCPICGKPREAAFAPFCSKRCADADLSKWFSESYTIPVPDDEMEAALEDGEDQERTVH
ncbi:MAG: DNA gyrase inhibitor YacG [Alphaproteobacteria bacterium]